MLRFGDCSGANLCLQAWTNDEHKRFLEALEQYGNGTTGSEWQLMADYVGSRSYNEIKLHAHKYFLKLQSATANKTSKSGGVDAGKQWTYEENHIFEDNLAKIEEGTTSSISVSPIFAFLTLWCHC